jgi:pimeloyl-ACP methyl ester carboxylesterase
MATDRQANASVLGAALPRWARGGLAALGATVAPLARLRPRSLHQLHAPERLDQGYTLILPGIEGRSFLNSSVAWGLADAGVTSGIEIHDWTTGFTLLFGYHLRGWRRNQRQAQAIARKIIDYQAAYPGRPVYLIGHSGGGALALLAAALLPAENHISGIVLLVPAVSPRFNLVPALRRTERGIWHFSSPFDLLFLGAGTSLLGTIDCQHTISAGACGFALPPTLTGEERALYASHLHWRPYEFEMAGGFNLGGHFGCTNRVFVSEWIAPIIANSMP